MVRISPECVTGPGQVQSSGRIATFSLWTGVFGTVFPLYLMKMYTAVTRSSLPRLWERGIPEGEDDCWVGEAVVLSLTTPYTPR